MGFFATSITGIAFCIFIFFIRTKLRPKTQIEWVSRNREVSKQDIQVINKTIQFFDSEENWNQSDDRLCLSGPKQSLFCSLAFSSQAVMGEYNHRGIPSQEIRNTIEDNFPGRWSMHPLMDFNNHPDTSFSDIQMVLSVTAERCKSKLEGVE